MATHLPDANASAHYATLNYQCAFFGITGMGGGVQFSVPNPVNFTFSFETGRTQVYPNVDLWEVSWDYSWFDQDAIEARLAVAISDICGGIAALLEVAVDTVVRAVSVTRVWTVSANLQGAAAPYQLSAGITVLEPMEVSLIGDADAVLGTDAGEHVTTQ